MDDCKTKKHIPSKAEKKGWSVFRNLTDLELVSLTLEQNDDLDRGMAIHVLEERRRKRQLHAQVVTIFISAFVGLIFGLLSTWISSRLFEKRLEIKQENEKYCISCGAKINANNHSGKRNSK